MKLMWKGIYKNKEQLPVFVLIGLAIFLKSLLTGQVIEIQLLNLCAIILALLTLFPHELLHAIAFPRGSEVELWVSPAHMGAFITSTTPVSKGRFIFLSLMSNVIFGFIPLFTWFFLPPDFALTNIALWFSFYCLLLGVGDYLNVWNAMRQMPKRVYATTVRNAFVLVHPIAMMRYIDTSTVTLYMDFAVEK